MTEGGEKIDYPEVGYPDGNERFCALEDYTGRGAVTLLESLPHRLADITSSQGSPGYGNMSLCLPVFMRNAAREMKRLRALPVAYRTRDAATQTMVDHPIRYGEMCVLVRGADGAAIAKRALAEAGIPYSHYKERGIYGTVEAEALIAFFDFLAAPGRAGNLAALLLTPLFAVHPSDLEAWLSSGDRRLTSLLEKWQELSARRSWVPLFESVMTDTELAHPSPDDYEYDRRWTLCRQILDRLLAEKGRSALVPADFADLLRAWRKDDRRHGEDGALRQKENETDSVQILTMHASKGLEFKAVFIASGFSKPRPDGSLEEEKRLYYVALTRAEHKLYLPWTRWDRHLRKDQTERGLGSCGSPLLGNGFLSRAIQASFPEDGTDAGRATVSLTDGAAARSDENGSSARNGRTPPRVYDIGQVRHLRLRWDSFTSLCRTDESPRVAPAAETQTDEMAVAAWPAGKSLPTLLPRNTVSGIVFHDIMETLCKTDESTGGVGFSLGARPLEEALAEDGPLSDLVRRAMRRNGLVNQVRGGDSTVRTLARLVWRALNTCIEIGGRKIFLKDVAFGDRLAEVEFVVDEPSVLGLDAPWTGAAPRDGALNGKIDLLIRPDGPNGPVYLLDWKTNALPDYGKDSVEKAMEEAGYPLQFKLYALAVSRWLGREALAGVAYLFVRGGEHGENSGVSTCVMDAAELADCRRRVRDAVASGGGSRG
jgi:ATP-dependent exoDNAse (exonuclease V) beta subunit